MFWSRPPRFGQVVSTLALSRITWPDALQKTFQWFSSLNLEIGLIPSVACMLKNTSFRSQLLVYGFGPVFVILVGCCAHACVSTCACACMCALCTCVLCVLRESVHLCVLLLLCCFRQHCCHAYGPKNTTVER